MHRGVITEALLANYLNGRDAARARPSADAAAEARAKSAAKAAAKRRAQRQAQRAAEDTWLFGDSAYDSDVTSDSDDGGFRMVMSEPSELSGNRGSSSTETASLFGQRAPRIVNLINFAECDIPLGESSSSSVTPRADSEASTRASRHSAPAVAAASAAAASVAMSRLVRNNLVGKSSGFDMPMQSKEDVLLEEIQYLRQMLADSVEERKIQVSDKQQMISELTAQKADAEAKLASFHVLKEGLDQVRKEQESGIIDAKEARLGERSVLLDSKSLLLDQRKVELDRREEEMRRTSQELERDSRAQLQEAERSRRELEEQHRAQVESATQQARKALLDQVASLEEELREVQERLAQITSREEEFREVQERLTWWEVPTEALPSLTSVAAASAWEQEYRKQTQAALSRLAERRIELRVAAIATQDVALCKICFDRPISCALLPCKHHAFCVPCGERIYTAREPLCPLCRKPVEDLFETFAG